MEQERRVIDVEWIGKIPDHWKISKIGELYTIKNIKVSDKDFPPLSVTKKGILPQLENAAKSDAHDNRKLVNKGDFVINSRSDRRGSCGISSLDGSVSLINIVLSPRRLLDSEYYNWLFHTDLFADEFYKWGHGIVDDLWTTTWQNMKNINIPVPPLYEQTKIANFINKKCASIDSLIIDEYNLIKKLEEYKQSLMTECVTKGLDENIVMKDSGIDYIGKINPNWHFTKIKYVCTKLNRDIKKDRILICSNSGKVTIRNENTLGLVSDDNKMYQGVEKGDLLIHGMDTWHGAIAVSNFNGKCTKVVHVCDSNHNKEFIAYYLQMLAFKNVYKSISAGVRENTSDFRSWEKTGAIYITMPPISEQNKITEYLNEKCKLIDSLIIEKETLIKKLEEYKKSLIFEYVTGKKEVPNEI